MKAPIPIRRTHSRARCRQRGSALLIVVFFAAVMIIGAAAAVPSVLTQGQREREEDLIWRGQQYARAVKLFYRKNGRFPQSMDNLTKPQNNVRFLRQAYTDPMNTEDGSWRLIYVGANGQLIGSTSRNSPLVNMPGARPAGSGAGAGITPAGGASGSGAGTSGGAGPSAGSSGAQNTTPGTLGTGPIIGGNIIGVGSKISKLGIKVYNGSQLYRDWEFIWDPTRDAVQGGQGGPQPGTPAGQPQGGPQNRPQGFGSGGTRRP